jgi:biotin operon repressor
MAGEPVLRFARRQETPVFQHEIVDAWCEAPLAPEWVAAFRLFVQRGQVVVGELRIFPSRDHGAYPGERRPGLWLAEELGRRAPVPEGGLTKRRARAAPFNAPLALAPRLFAQLAEIDDEPTDPRVAVDPDVARIRRPPGRNARASDERLAGIAARYVRLASASRAPLPELARELGYSRGHVKRLVQEARRRGLLTEAPDRRAGGQLTPRALELLDA